MKTLIKEQPLGADEVLVVIWQTEDIRAGMRIMYEHLFLSSQPHQSGNGSRINTRSAQGEEKLPKPIHRFRAKRSEVDSRISLLK